MRKEEYEYCYQCRYSVYDKKPQMYNNDLCLYCKYDIRGTYLPKGALIGDCAHFKPRELSPIVKKINRLRGIS